MALLLSGTRAILSPQVLVVENSALIGLPLTGTDLGFPMGIPVIGSIYDSLYYHDKVHMNVCKTASSNLYGFYVYSTHSLRRIDNWGIFLDNQKCIYRSTECLVGILEREMNRH